MPKIAIPPFRRRHVVHPVLGEDLGEYSNANLGDAAGLTQFGAHLEVLHPGGATSVRHWHEHEDELVYVLSGELMLDEDGIETPLKAGDAAGWKSGVPVAHRLVNRGTADATYLIVGTRSPGDVRHFPDHGVTATEEGGRHRYRRADGSLVGET
jgi:uncharacterized cupin superfamily protein